MISPATPQSPAEAMDASPTLPTFKKKVLTGAVKNNEIDLERILKAA